jgi:hypothetical protein
MISTSSHNNIYSPTHCDEKASNSVILELLNTLREVIHTFGVYMLGMYFLAFQKILWDTPLSKESGITTGRQSNTKLLHFAA